MNKQKKKVRMLFHLFSIYIVLQSFAAPLIFCSLPLASSFLSTSSSSWGIAAYNEGPAVAATPPRSLTSLFPSRFASVMRDDRKASAPIPEREREGDGEREKQTETEREATGMQRKLW